MSHSSINYYFGVYLKIILTEDNVDITDIAGDMWDSDTPLREQNPFLYPCEVVLMDSRDKAWLYLTEMYAAPPYTKEFPTADEVGRAIGEFKEYYKEVLARIAESDFVESFSVKAGYVADEDW